MIKYLVSLSNNDRDDLLLADDDDDFLLLYNNTVDTSTTVGELSFSCCIDLLLGTYNPYMKYNVTVEY